MQMRLRLLSTLAVLTALVTLAGCTLSPIEIEPIVIGGNGNGNGLQLLIKSPQFLPNIERTGQAPLTIEATLKGQGKSKGDKPVLWDWGDGDTSYSALGDWIAHTYKDAGRYTIVATLEESQLQTEIVVLPPSDNLNFAVTEEGKLVSVVREVGPHPLSKDQWLVRLTFTAKADLFGCRWHDYWLEGAGSISGGEQEINWPADHRSYGFPQAGESVQYTYEIKSTAQEILIYGEGACVSRDEARTEELKLPVQTLGGN